MNALIEKLRARTVPRWTHATAGTPVMTAWPRWSTAWSTWANGHKPDPDAQEAAAEIERLRAANEAFGVRQKWWTDTMFEMEQEVERLRAVEKRFNYLQAQFTQMVVGFGNEKAWYWEGSPARLKGDTMTEAIDKVIEAKT